MFVLSLAITLAFLPLAASPGASDTPGPVDAPGLALDAPALDARALDVPAHDPDRGSHRTGESNPHRDLEHDGLRVEEGPRVAVITGSTGGLGRELARTLGARGWHVVIHGRNAEAGAAVVAEIEAGPGSARFLPADLASMEATRELGEAILEALPRIDLFVANAGIWLDPADGRQENDDGHELQFQVNYLAHFLLSHQLLPRLRATADAHGEARIIQIASVAQTPIDFDDVMLTREGAHARGYGQSKLAQILLARDLADELDGSGVLSVSLHPATLMNTGMVLDRGIEPRATVEEGLTALLRLVDADDLTPGAYYQGLVRTTPNPQADHAEARVRLRALSRTLTGLDAG